MWITEEAALSQSYLYTYMHKKSAIFDRTKNWIKNQTHLGIIEGKKERPTNKERNMEEIKENFFNLIHIHIYIRDRRLGNPVNQSMIRLRRLLISLYKIFHTGIDWERNESSHVQCSAMRSGSWIEIEASRLPTWLESSWSCWSGSDRFYYLWEILLIYQINYRRIPSAAGVPFFLSFLLSSIYV